MLATLQAPPAAFSIHPSTSSRVTFHFTYASCLLQDRKSAVNYSASVSPVTACRFADCVLWSLSQYHTPRQCLGSTEISCSAEKGLIDLWPKDLRPVLDLWFVFRIRGQLTPQVTEDSASNVKIKCPNAGKDFAPEEISAQVGS